MAKRRALYPVAAHHLRFCFSTGSMPMDFCVGIIRHDHSHVKVLSRSLDSRARSIQLFPANTGSSTSGVANLGEQAPLANRQSNLDARFPKNLSIIPHHVSAIYARRAPSLKDVKAGAHNGKSSPGIRTRLFPPKGIQCQYEGQQMKKIFGSQLLSLSGRSVKNHAFMSALAPPQPRSPSKRPGTCALQILRAARA